jgi:hypothetical protein
LSGAKVNFSGAFMDKQDPGVIRGELFTDGTTFIITLAGTPLSGTGASADAAYADLMRASDAAGDLRGRLEAMAREQQGEIVRATVIRWIMIALICFGVVGGALAGAAAIAPSIAVNMTEAGAKTLSRYAKSKPEAFKTLSSLLGHSSGLPASAAPAAPASSAPSSPRR